MFTRDFERVKESKQPGLVGHQPAHQTSVVNLNSSFCIKFFLNCVTVMSTGGVWSPGSSGHIRLRGRHQAGQTGRALSESDVNAVQKYSVRLKE